jgi:GT2 family glycosyltransferase
MKDRRSNLPRISFIVPVCNDAVRLERCLRSILESWYPPERREILVADNGSEDGSAAVASRLGARVISVPNARVAEVRNQAAKSAAGEILAYVDADHEVVPGWIGSAVETLRWPAVGAVGALYQAPPDGTWVQRAYGQLRGRSRGRHDVEWLGSGNLAVWRSAFEAIGGFNTALETCEDVDFCHRLRASGFRVISDERMKNIHHGDPATLRELFVGELWRGRDNLRVSFRRPLTPRTMITAIIPLVDVALIAMIGVGLALAARGGLWLSLAAGFALSVPVWARVARAFLNHPRGGVAGLVQAFAVACVYDLGRALALIARMPHRGRRSAAA